MIVDISSSMDGSLEGKLEFRLFNKMIPVSINDQGDLDYANDCAKKLNNLSEDIIERLCDFSIAYCNNFCEYVGAQPPAINSKRDILHHISPLSLHIEEPEDRTILAFSVELDCSWEMEHGMQWVIKDDQVLYVGAFEGFGPWEELSYYEQCCPNFAFGKTYDDF